MFQKRFIHIFIKAEMENAERRFSLDLILYSLIKHDRALPENALGQVPGIRRSNRHVWVTVHPT